MNLADRLSEYVRACFTGIWIQSYEHPDALAEIAKLCGDESWRLAVWDLAQGLVIDGQAAEAAGDPLAAIKALGGLAQADGSALLVLVNFHRFLNSAEVVQAVAHQLAAGKQRRTFVVVLAPVVQIPVELERQFVVIDHNLPGREQLLEIARALATQPGDLPEGAALDQVLDAAVGLTRHEAEAAFSLSLTRHDRITAPPIWQLKAEALNRGGLVQLYRGDQRFSGLGGLAALKAFCLRALRRSAINGGDLKPRGVLLLGVPGTGKSAIAKALGNETGRPTLVLDIGTLYGSLVGQSEQNVRQALKIIDAMSPAVVFIDEIEKAIGGATSGNAGDSGVSSRLLGTLLTWLNDHESDTFIVATCNDISRLPPEFSRAERFDAIYFLDLPSAEQREAIWQLYLSQFNLDPNQDRPADDGFTGAEIKACCRLAALLDLPLVAAAQNVVPIARTAGESVERLRQWASSRCLDAERGGIYQPRTIPAGPKRRISRGTVDPSAN
jgi:ATPase family associated with various cellular activities (AAA)